MDSVLVQKEINIEDKSFNIQKSVPLKPVEIYNFLIKYLPVEKDKRNHPDFKHIFDYIESIKQYNDYYLLSILSIPQCPLNTNGLGNFFGQKMNNITKDLKIFPFGNTVVSNISLVSKRTTNHKTIIVLSLKGNKKIHDPHPSNPHPINNSKNSVGYFLVDNWTNTVSKRYINYLYTYGLKYCVDETFLKSIPTNSIVNNAIVNIHKSKDKELEKKIHHNNIDNIDTKYTKEINDTKDLKDLNEIKDECDEDNNAGNDNNNNNEINNTMKEIIENIETVTKLINPAPLYFDDKYYQYQQEIINLKSLVFYLINNKGTLKSDIYNIFSEELLKSVFGQYYMNFLQ
jgi:hypothetical protein